MTCEERARKPLETRPHRRERCPRGRGASASHRTVQAWVDSKKKQPGMGPPEPKNEKCGPTAGGNSGPTAVKKHRQQQAARTGEDWLRQEDCDPTDGESDTHTCCDVYQVVKTRSKVLAAEALRGVNSTIFDAQGSRIDNELGKRDYVTGSALERGCELDEVADTTVVSGSRKQNENTELHMAVVVQRQASTARTVLKVQRLSSRGSSTRSSTSLSRRRGRTAESQRRFQQTIKMPQSKDSEDHEDSPGWRPQKTH